MTLSGELSVDDLARKAVTDLQQFIQSLIATVVLPSLQTKITVTPNRITPIGLGGFVAFNQDPRGEILGRRVDALVSVFAEMPTVMELAEGVSALIQALLTAGRKTLVEGGIQRLLFVDLEPVIVATRQDGSVFASREIKFNVQFEYLQRPEAAEDVIREIPIILNVN